MARVFINGFGRIGRSVLRAATLAPERWPGLEIVGLNDIATPEICAYLFQYDSVFGPFPGRVALEEGALVVNGRAFPLHRAADLSALDLAGVDVVMECTGRADSSEIAGRGLAAGAHRVLVSGPSKAAEVAVVLGANDAALRDQRIVSNASCTTNALAPLVRLLNEGWGVVTGSMTTIHCYTGSQPTVDAPGGDFARSRAAALSMVPTTTSAQRLLDLVLPELAGRVQGSAVRVPVASVSAVDLAVMTERPANVVAVNAAFRATGGVIGATDLPLVSSDLRARPESIVMALPETRITAGGMLRVFGWYDNEWGFSNRMLDMALRMT
ncbi:glyceraldehyde-3-phosphate dehydrogenase [Rhodobacter veldkampii DSM 11550]|uniref:Glyceraldehyde-3-phosphate dehydrogenase n=1 Tax=Phaeovulum veldkampii DSM 11550 TaxID=1185920 RepID=A0A2T4JHA2_9RHOB|nr:glyceraldehyde 3-phosphate dehydrogenase NAD-binding domain-containing protein [Phaeovulum veldkampii]MBK5945891.1 glyceraldehyde-3-phosphate dehydrogenase [Phaeovulum veldkampii DSM 11550]PTE17290.1 glyceraldehyde-3-phosphate dehydrogenase [Phaeovulum veldkampii DSM 11550]TDQ56370.1 glyceraldehyde 3-phosphate dehydrogenase [Phaeovulum veldkampii DSM 11550]